MYWQTVGRARARCRHPETRSVHQRRSRHDVAVPARRSLRYRRRRRDGPRPGSLRAVRRGVALPSQQHHDRSNLSGRHHERATWRVLRLDGAGHPTHHRRDQGGDPPADAEPRRGDRGDWGHRRRHRVVAVPGGDPPATWGRGARAHSVHPRDVDPIPAGGRRAEDKADTALGAGADGDRDHARHPDLPYGTRANGGDAPQDRAVLQRQDGGSDRGAGCGDDLRSSAHLPRPGSRPAGDGEAETRCTGSGSVGLGLDRRASEEPQTGARQDRRGRQVHGVGGLL